MDLLNLLNKLQAIEVQEGLSDKQKEIAKQAGDPEKIEGEDFAALKKKKANEDIENVLRGLMAIQESDDACDECGKVHEGACKEEDLKECGDMAMSPLTAPNAGIELSPMAAAYDDATDSYAGEPNGPAEPVEATPIFTLTVRNGENNLSMTTDVPEEIMHVMKLAGVQGKAEIKKAEPEQGEQKEVEEAWGNTPAATKEKEPRAYGDIRDWALKGTGKGQPGSAMNKPAGSGDNPLSESSMLKEYRKFKSGK